LITGIVDNIQARVNVAFRQSPLPDIEIEFVVDTGFAGTLALPLAAVTALGLPYLQEMVANLANDDNVKADVHIADIVWNGEELKVAVLAMGKRPLLGTALLESKKLVVQFVESGLVTIDEL
jgi:clan AA aspartic protease